jgi:hypothetical protein
MTNWIFLSKDGKDPYVNMFAEGCGVKPVADFNYDDSNSPIVLRGILKHKIMKRCWQDKRDFYYIDTGYWGNERTTSNPNGWKYWHRIVKNDVQHSEIVDRPDDRWKKLNYSIEKRKAGRHILLVTPSEKPCKFYGINRDQWVKETIETIKQYTDRPIRIRDKAPREQRITSTIFEELTDCHALVTYQSIAAVESVLYGVPAFTLAPTAADPVCDKDLSLIETPTQQDADKIYKWACHLAYGQYHIDEFKDGTALKLLDL